MNKKRKNYIKNCEISCLEKVVIGGFEQKISIEGKSKRLPVVLFLHGGPGSPIPFCVGCRGLFPDITDKFIMVYWDQLGCGINNRIIDDSFTVSNFVDMTVDLIKYLRGKFPNNKLYLFGTSWGSILALKAAVTVPELIDGVVVNGQVTTSPMFSDDCFDTVASSAAPKKYKDFADNLRKNKQNIAFSDAIKLSKIIRKYTDGYLNRKAESLPVGKLLKGLLGSPDYKFKDFLAVLKNGYAKNQSLFYEMLSLNLSSLFSEITIPYMIFQGDTDIVTDTKEVIKCVEGCNNKLVSYQILRDCGHMPTGQSIQIIFDYMLKNS